MSVWPILGEISLSLLIVFFLAFSLFSLLERELRAFGISSIFFLLLLFTNIGLFFLEEPLRSWTFGSAFALVFLFVLFTMFPPLKKHLTAIVGEQKRVDERDVIFARFEYQEGTEIFEDYYKRKPEYKRIDDEIREIPDILSPFHTKRNLWNFSLAAAEFDFLEHQLNQVSGSVRDIKLTSSAYENTQKIKSIIGYLGSDVCGICSLNQVYLYSNVGRGPEPHGSAIDLKHKFAIVFAVEMDLKMVRVAPHAPVIVETAKRYVEAARISIILAHLIRRLGYPARTHIAGSNYQAVLPPLGWEAGIGELGRLGILITYKYGPRARLGLVTTDLPLIPDRPKAFGVQDFCQKCQKCARNCPAQAIDYGEKVEENGVLKWVLKREECYRFWRKVGTDCALCIFVCPYSKPHNFFHRVIRKMTERSSAAQTLSVWGDDFFYGSSPRHHGSLFDFRA